MFLDEKATDKQTAPEGRVVDQLRRALATGGANAHTLLQLAEVTTGGAGPIGVRVVLSCSRTVVFFLALLGERGLDRFFLFRAGQQH
jgi:hypothetical protein